MVDMTEYEKAMEELNNLAKDYEIWVQTDMQNLKDAYSKAQNADGNTRVDIMMKEVFKVAHDMKGQGATFGYDLITDIGNHLCRYIEKQTSFEDAQMEAVKCHIDAMEEILNTHLTGDGGARGAELKSKTEAF